jgi:hypothetical protein
VFFFEWISIQSGGQAIEHLNIWVGFIWMRQNGLFSPSHWPIFRPLPSTIFWGLTGPPGDCISCSDKCTSFPKKKRKEKKWQTYLLVAAMHPWMQQRLKNLPFVYRVALHLGYSKMNNVPVCGIRLHRKPLFETALRDRRALWHDDRTLYLMMVSLYPAATSFALSWW